ncbi:hypothetical protein [Amycolatopsis lexingtonensis]|uniref:hypothetical protein n=1 Tax=Amycolatopsis lexingtonensis TaxID=218822 RepID=UPI003F6E6B60
MPLAIPACSCPSLSRYFTIWHGVPYARVSRADFNRVLLQLHPSARTLLRINSADIAILCTAPPNASLAPGETGTARKLWMGEATAHADALGILVDALYGSSLEPSWPLWDTREDLPGEAERDRVTALLDHPRSVDSAALRTLTVVRRLEDNAGIEHVIPLVDAQVQLVEQFAEHARFEVRSVAVGLLSDLEQYRGWPAIPGQQRKPAGAHLDRAAVVALEADDLLRLSTTLSFSAHRASRRRQFRTADALSDAARPDTRVHLGLRTYEIFQRARLH